MVDHPAQQLGGVKFVLLHHGACPQRQFHFRIDARGARSAELAESERGQHPRSIAVVLDGDFDIAPPAPAQLDALRRLLLALKLRYPAAALGAHRQVRGDQATTCPGRRFPMPALAAWARVELPRARDAAQRRTFEEQYSKL